MDATPESRTPNDATHNAPPRVRRFPEGLPLRTAALAILLSFVTTAAYADIPPPRLRQPVRKPLKIKKLDTKIRLVGELAEGGVERCLPDWKREWVNRYPMVGFTPLKPKAGVDPAPHYGRLVVVEGVVDPAGLGRQAPVENTGECAMEQMRSDWVNTPGGMRVMRPGMGAVAGALTATKITPWDGLALRVEGDELVAVLTNTFTTTLVAPTIRVHYEGCFGKPGTTSREKSARDLTAGEKLTFRAPLLLDEEGRPDARRSFAAASVQITSETKTVVFDFDCGLRREGLTAACPKDSKGE